ncbi:envelope glycoprotein H [Cercopithecine betaherpesvirus 5]|uniref:Envelope glycoprotein H n=1 Tax=Simian cytomegalovirus (strain Colburn) TaxID=50292 RepID=G8XTD7_SCMVC|nr:envelope glycoprotein H [Cercopithecine betaherpesvirus 5]AEV80429.1 envelope glycoprotein H [Cercopithecine betaherpesvirus 5]
MARGLVLGCALTWLILQITASSDILPPMALELTLRPLSFLRENSTRCNNNGTQRNISTVRENAMTFNFYEKPYQYTVFQVPRCLFTGELAESFLNQVDLSTPLKEYLDKLNRYATASQDDIQYKYYGQNLSQQNHLQEHPSTVPPPTNLNLQTTISYGTPATVNASGLHTPIFNDTCYLFKDHELLFTAAEPCSFQAFYITQHDYVQLTLTEKFFALTVVIRETPLLLLFGDLDRVMFKAPYNKMNFILKQTTKHKLIFLVKKDHLIHHTYIKTQDFLNDTFSINYQDLQQVISVWNKYAVGVLQNGQCHSMTQKTVETAFTYGLMLYTASISPSTETSISRAIDQHASILLAEELLSSCMAKTQPRNTLVYPKATQMANETLRTSGKISSILTVSRLVYVLARQNQHNLITKTAMEQVLQLIRFLHKAHISSFISRFARQELYLAGSTIHSMLNHSAERRKIFVLETGLCTLAELSHWSQLIGSQEHLYVSDLYSPCAGSGRRDHALEHFQKMFPKATRSRTVQTALSVLDVLRPQTLGTFPEVSCVSTDKSFAVLTVSSGITYTVSGDYLLRGTSFPVMTTVVGHSIIITQVPTNSTCSPSSSKHETLPIVMLRNLSLEQCDFCESAMVEYDDSQGIVNVMYIDDREDLLFALDESNNIFVKSPRTHYLMLLKNGTVFEVTEAVIDQTDTHIALIVIYALAAIFGLYVLYRIVKLM